MINEEIKIKDSAGRDILFTPMIEDKITSLWNKTRINRKQAIIYSNFLMGKYNIDRNEAMKKLVNYAIDKKLELKSFETVLANNRKELVVEILNINNL